MSDVTLIQCTDSKRDKGACPRNLYDKSSYFKKMRAWADARGDPWYVLSAKHGLLHPDGGEIEPYNEFGLSEGQAKRIASELAEMGVTRVYVCAGSDYINPLTPELESRGIDVVDPFAGMRIGKRQQVLAKKTRALENHTLTNA